MKSYLTKEKIGLVLGPLLFYFILQFVRPIGMSEAAIAVLAVTSWIAVWWITEAIQVEVTALLTIVLLPLTGGLNLADTCASFGHKYIFLFLGGFILAIAIEKWNLHKRIALNIIKTVGHKTDRILLGFMGSTALLSMWISNTATAVMMLPIAMAIVVHTEGSKKKAKNSQFGKALLLSIAYSASIGGMATLIGTPPNLVFAGVVEKTYGYEISFLQWLSIGVPIALILLFISWEFLSKYAFKLKPRISEDGFDNIAEQLKKLGKITFEEKTVLIVFGVTAFAWITRSFLIKPIIPEIDDTIIAMISGIALLALPSKTPGTKLLAWKDAVKLPWGILMLFGGGIALASGFQESGLATWIALQLQGLDDLNLFILLLILVAAINFLTEITSNLATASVLLPILAPLALAMNVHPFVLMIGGTLAASCAFMLPVATPPNAIVFSSGYIKMGEMIRKGIWMNILSIIFITLIVYFLLPLVWGIDIQIFPTELLRNK